MWKLVSEIRFLRSRLYFVFLFLSFRHVSRRELKQSLCGRFTFLQKGVFLIREAAPRVEGQGFPSVMACFSFCSAHMAFTILLKIDLMKWIKWMKPAGDQYSQAPLLWSMLLLGLTTSGLRGIRGNLMWWSKIWCVTEKTRSCFDEETEHFLWSRHKPDYVKEGSSLIPSSDIEMMAGLG